VNRLTYCKVGEFSTRAIEIETIFSCTFRVIISFEISSQANRDHNNNQEICDISVDIKRSAAGIVLNSLEDCLANAFFASVMACDQCDGPLSARALSRIERVKDIPQAMAKVSIDQIALIYSLL
jgi:hypothetical protein